MVKPTRQRFWRCFLQRLTVRVDIVFHHVNHIKAIVTKLTFFGIFGGGSFAKIAQSAHSWLGRNVLAAGLVLTLVTSVHAVSNGQAESNGNEKSADGHFVNTQGQDIELPEDFMVRVDGNKLQVALVSLGAIDSQMSTSSLLVRLLNSDGQEKEAMTNMQGIAEFTGVQPDELHALLVVDDRAHAAVPLMTVSTQNAVKRNIVSKNIRLPLMPPNRQEILASISRGILPTSDPGGDLYSSGDYSPQAVNPYIVRLQSDGNMLGRVVVSDRDLANEFRYANLTFLRNNHVVARVDSNPSDGSFNVFGLSAGVYGVIAAGPAGYSSFAFEVLPAAVRPALFGEGVLGKPVSLVQPDPNEKLYVFLCPPRLVPQITDRIRQAYGQSNIASTMNQPVSGLTMAGSGGFGGGGGSFGGGGGRGIGGIAAIAGLATVAAIAASNDNNSANNVPVSPVSR